MKQWCALYVSLYSYDLCHHSFHPAMNHPLLHTMCPLFVSLYSNMFYHSPSRSSMAARPAVLWRCTGLSSFATAADGLTLFRCVMTILTSWKGLCGNDRGDMSCQGFCTVCLLKTFPSQYSICKQHVIPDVQRLHVVFSCCLFVWWFH